MGLGRRSRVELIGFGAVRETRGFGRKRVGISKAAKEDESGSCGCSYNDVSSTLKRQCSDNLVSSLETLPQELLIRVLCGVEHDDLKQLILVSKSVMEAALVAKKLHFAYSTPPTKVKTFRNKLEVEDDLDVELEAPGAPIQSRKCRRRIGLMSEEVISISLSQSDDELNAVQG